MWNTSVKIEYIAGLIVDALENYSVNGEYTQFNHVIEELRKHFTNCSDEEITDIISLCMKMYSSKKIEHAELVLTAPDAHLYHRYHRVPLQKRIYYRSAINRISLQDIGICIPHGDRREACDLSGTLSSIQNVCASI